MLTYRFQSENLKSYVSRCRVEWPKNRVFRHETLVAAIDIKTRPILCSHNTMAGKVGQLVSIKPLLKIQYEPDLGKFYYSAIDPHAHTSEATWLPKTEVEEILRRNKAYLPDGMPVSVKTFLMCWGAGQVTESPKILNWLATIFQRASLEFGDSPSVIANRLIERSGQLQLVAEQQLIQAIAA